MTSDSVLRCTSMCTRAAEYEFHKGWRVSQAILDSRNMGEGDLPKALDQVNGKFLVRYELGLFGLPFSYTSLYKKSLSPFHNTHGKHPALDPELLLQQSTELRKSG
ncbi:hypothetical protein RirG_032020 [Rhizophagus irregularis DAOM 197198w]|jgi:hypothetical protein|uniref:Uncharacterized protein n=1 Tax=Rhizophagus irregularis (strain DAOM 197198w) TaxID=1432141 RepID=A0A015LV45_RHIIW|nr:hypothetical protein RirG_032020 [Rhizophagus irregularis DAOM 197198w]